MSGKLIVIEGADGAGKATQTALLTKRLKGEGYKINALSFPDYESDSSALIKMYLRGDFGKDAGAVSPYAASLFYAADRYASYQMKWKAAFEAGEIFLADRYVTSNLAHQGIKLPKEERENFIKWLSDLEYDKLGLPKPDMVLFLDVPPEISLKLVKDRGRSDIHEKNSDYLKNVYDIYNFFSEKFGWKKIECAREEAIKSVEEIGDMVYNEVKKIL